MIPAAENFAGLKVLGFGDNVVDRYLNMGKMYPGGNALNIAVYAKMLGADAAYLGTFGTDCAAAHVQATLEKLGISTGRCRIAEGENGHADVRLVEGNREFVFSNRGGVAREHPFHPSEADLSFIGQFDLVHTSCYSHLNPHLASISASSKLLSYDFSYRWRVDDLIGPVAPHLDFAALSAGDVGRADAEGLLRDVIATGCSVAIATLGADGALFYAGGDFIEVAARPTTVVDTLGAGDAFITGTLLSLLKYGWVRGSTPAKQDIVTALETGAEFAAKICTIDGAFGHAASVDVAPAV